MKVTLTHDGKSVELDLTNEQLTTLGLKEEKKKTGYERVEEGGYYYTVISDGETLNYTESRKNIACGVLYDVANYYSDEALACDNARADRLMRELRRFAAENGGIPSVENWEKSRRNKWEINYCYDTKKIAPMLMTVVRGVGVVHFNTEEACDKAVEKFHDELIWYFTEYEAMLR